MALGPWFARSAVCLIKLLRGDEPDVVLVVEGPPPDVGVSAGRVKVFEPFAAGGRRTEELEIRVDPLLPDCELLIVHPVRFLDVDCLRAGLTGELDGDLALGGHAPLSALPIGGVLPFPAVHFVGTSAAVELVVPGASGQGVVVQASGEDVAAGTAVERVLAGTALQVVKAGVAVEVGVAATPISGVVLVAAREPVVAVLAVDVIATLPPYASSSPAPASIWSWPSPP